MNLVKLDSVQTMSSREIAELLNTRHDVVKRTIERLSTAKMDAGGNVLEPVFCQPPLVDGEKSANNVIEKLYLVTKRESYIIVAQLSPEFTAKLVDRWQELESQQAPQLPTNYICALEELLASKKAEAALQEQLALAAPAVEFVDKFVSASTGSMGFREVCKLLSINEATFRKFLESEKIIYKLNGGKTPYANHLDAGRFETKAGINSKTGHAFNAYRFTTKGVEWVAGEFANWQLRGGI